jgi:hypothetical protein
MQDNYRDKKKYSSTFVVTISIPPGRLPKGSKAKSFTIHDPPIIRKVVLHCI